jgi:hypothetical protein
MTHSPDRKTKINAYWHQSPFLFCDIPLGGDFGVRFGNALSSRVPTDTQNIS